MYMDFRVHVWRNNYGILATNVNPVTVRGSITAGDNWPQCTAKAVAYSRLTSNFNKKLSRQVIKTFQGNEQLCRNDNG